MFLWLKVPPNKAKHSFSFFHLCNPRVREALKTCNFPFFLKKVKNVTKVIIFRLLHLTIRFIFCKNTKNTQPKCVCLSILHDSHSIHFFILHLKTRSQRSPKYPEMIKKCSFCPLICHGVLFSCQFIYYLFILRPGEFRIRKPPPLTWFRLIFLHCVFGNNSFFFPNKT